MVGFDTLLGLTMISSWTYMAIAQFKTLYKERNTFGKIATWFAIASFALFVVGSTQAFNTQKPTLTQSSLNSEL